MSGGVAYVLDTNNTLQARLNPDMVKICPAFDAADIGRVCHLIEAHIEKTNSLHARAILANWRQYLPCFKKVAPIQEVTTAKPRSSEAKAPRRRQKPMQKQPWGLPRR